jgi:hypothetical protein
MDINIIRQKLTDLVQTKNDMLELLDEIEFNMEDGLANYCEYKKCQQNISQIDTEISDLEKLIDNSYKE